MKRRTNQKSFLFADQVRVKKCEVKIIITIRQNRDWRCWTQGQPASGSYQTPPAVLSTAAYELWQPGIKKIQISKLIQI